MLELMKAELRRYRNAAGIFAATSLLLAFLMFRSSGFLGAHWAIHAVGLALFLGAGMALAIFQFRTYRKPARWLWLLHRPLPHLQTLAALHLAAMILALLAILLPLALALLAAKGEHVTVIDTRHFLGVMHLTLFAILGWQVASYTLLAKHRGASLVVCLPVMLAGLYFASAYTLLVPMLLCLGVMGGALLSVFRPERRCTHQHAGAMAWAAIPMVACTYFLLIWGATIAFNIGFSVMRMSATENLVRDGFLEALASSWDSNLVGTELARSGDPRAAQWRSQIQPAKARAFYAHMLRYPNSDQPANPGASALYRNNILWTYSHDRRRFVAHDRNIDTAQESSLGPYGTHDRTPFAQPAVTIPLAKDTQLIFDPQHLYLLDQRSLAMRTLVVLAGDEKIASLPEADDTRLTIVTNRRLIEYAWPATGQPLTERYSIALPGQLSDLSRVEAVDVADGQLVSLLFGLQQENGALHSRVATYHIQDGQVETVHQRTLVEDVGFLYTQKNFWISPTLFALFELPRVLLDSGKVLDAGYATDSMRLSMPRPAAAQFLAGVMLTSSALLAWIWLRQEPTSAAFKAAWVIACLCLGLPALLCLLMLQARERKQLALPAWRSASAA